MIFATASTAKISKFKIQHLFTDLDQKGVQITKNKKEPPH